MIQAYLCYFVVSSWDFYFPLRRNGCTRHREVEIREWQVRLLSRTENNKLSSLLLSCFFVPWLYICYLNVWVLNSPGTSVAVSSILMGLVMLGRAAFVFPLSFLVNLSKKTQSEKIDIKQQVRTILSCLYWIRFSVEMLIASLSKFFGFVYRLWFGGLVWWEVLYLWPLPTIR